jgi:hypothetical protein
MARFILLGGLLALLAVGAITLAKLPNSAAAQHHAALVAPAKPLDPALLITLLQKAREEMALP